jgi:hypothetical protein
VSAELYAPPGFVAHPERRGRCEHCCAGVEDDDRLCESLPCLPSDREDGRWVYFTRSTTGNTTP